MLDYALPRASYFPNLELAETVTPSPVNPIGVKGVGEAGAIASTAAVANAVIDATQPTRHPTSRYAVHPADGLAGDADRKGRPGMIPAAFDYQRASTIDEALGALSSGDGSVKLLAGGQSLLPLLKMRLAFTDKLVDIGRIAELKGVRQLDDGRLAIGALTTYAELIDSPAEEYGLLRDVLPIIGDLQVRNRGTVGGSIAHADPASDLPACLLALDAEIVARSSRGERVIPIDGFFQGPFQTDLADDEILTEVRLPGARVTTPVRRTCRSSSRRRGTRSLASPPSSFGTGGRRSGIASAKVALTGVGDHAYRARGVEEALAGSDGSEASIAAAAAHAADGIEVAQRHPRRSRVPNRDGGRLHATGDRGGPRRGCGLTGRRSLSAPRAGRADHSGPATAGPARRVDPRPGRDDRGGALVEGPAAVLVTTSRRSARPMPASR